jgi:hypothetical protein
VTKNKTRCTYSSGQGELATPLALHIVEVLELLKASPMVNIHQTLMVVLFPSVEFIVLRQFFFFKMDHCLAISHSTTLKVICATITHIHFKKELHTCKKNFLKAHQLRSTTSQNTTKQATN